MPARWFVEIRSWRLDAVVLVVLIAIGVGVAAFTEPAFAQSVGGTPQIQTPGSVFRDCENCPEMVVIPPGDFMMGTSKEESAVYDRATWWFDTSFIQRMIPNEQPQHKVTIDKQFAIAKFPVTKAEFAFFVRSTGRVTQSGCTLYSTHSGNGLPPTRRNPPAVPLITRSPSPAPTDRCRLRRPRVGMVRGCRGTECRC